MVKCLKCGQVGTVCGEWSGCMQQERIRTRRERCTGGGNVAAALVNAPRFPLR